MIISFLFEILNENNDAPLNCHRSLKQVATLLTLSGEKIVVSQKFDQDFDTENAHFIICAEICECV